MFLSVPILQGKLSILLHHPCTAVVTGTLATTMAVRVVIVAPLFHHGSAGIGMLAHRFSREAERSPREAE